MLENSKSDFLHKHSFAITLMFIFLFVSVLIGFLAFVFYTSDKDSNPDPYVAPFLLKTSFDEYYMREYAIQSDGTLVGKVYRSNLTTGDVVMVRPPYDLIWRLPLNLTNPGTK